MSLKKYNEKRDFKETNEPKGKVQRSGKDLKFVIQKHKATRLHYDLRLEIDGVLKSWAIPKGPSLDPNVKRLAMITEDHPYQYKDFEGNIPKGNYGAGSMIVWDEGYYTTKGQKNKTDETEVKESLSKGDIKLTFFGQKIKGDYALVKMKSDQENAWLLIKKEDEFATKKNVLLQDVSVKSKNTIDILEASKNKMIIEGEMHGGIPKLPVSFIPPMLAKPHALSFEDEDWIFEQKLDGYRCIAVVENNKVNLFSRNQNSYNIDFKVIADDLKNIKHDVVLDGEIVVLNNKKQPDFHLLQNYSKTGKGQIKYFVFDVLNINGTDTTSLQLTQRKELLETLLEQVEFKNVQYTSHIKGTGKTLLENAKKNDAEGIIAKNSKSTYYPGKRSDDWLKIKLFQQEDAVIIGITESVSDRNFFGAILLANFQNGELTYIGKCGSGFNEGNLEKLYNLFKPYFIKSSPTEKKISVKEKIQFIEPHFICSIKFTEWTNENKMRHPVFLGLREDKEMEEVTNENDLAGEVPKLDSENNFDKNVGGAVLQLTNQNKIYFPKGGITKGEILKYYDSIAPYILPYIENKPQSLNRFPNGIEKANFYQKDMDVNTIPSWLQTQQIPSGDGLIDYLVCNNNETLLYMANLGCIDINPWSSNISNLENPDWLIIDLDPSTTNFEEVIQTALTTKEVLDNWDINCYCKTSGASGLHIYVPLNALYNYDTVKLFAQLIAREVQIRLPKITTLERALKKRKGRIYIDYLQNRKGQTVAAPYSVRPKPGATVSTPLKWSEVNKTLSPSQFDIYNIKNRLEKVGDLWKPVLGEGIDIRSTIEKFNL